MTCGVPCAVLLPAGRSVGELSTHLHPLLHVRGPRPAVTLAGSHHTGVPRCAAGAAQHTPSPPHAHLTLTPRVRNLHVRAQTRSAMSLLANARAAARASCGARADSAAAAIAVQVRRSCRDSAARTAGTRVGAIERLLTPNPVRTRARSGSAAASPQTPTGLPVSRPPSHAAATRSRTAGCHGSSTVSYTHP